MTKNEQLKLLELLKIASTKKEVSKLLSCVSAEELIDFRNIFKNELLNIKFLQKIETNYDETQKKIREFEKKYKPD